MTHEFARHRLGIAFAGTFAVLGITVPYLGLWLEGRGLSETQISLVMTVTTWVRAAFTPYVGNRADRGGRHRQIVRFFAILATVLTALLFFDLRSTGGPSIAFAFVFAFTLLANVAFMPVIPLVDGIVVRTVQHHQGLGGRTDYAGLRIWASSSFLVVALAAGAFLEGRSPEWILVLWCAMTGIAALSTIVLPHPPSTGVARAPKGTFWKLLRRRELVVLFVANALIQGSHGCYYAFGSIWWERAGHSRDFIGVLWAEGVLAEIAFFFFAARILTVRPKILLYVGALAAMVRWSIVATRTDAISLVAVQWLHAGSFASTHLATMRWIQKQVAPERVVTAQTLLATIGAGLGPGLAIAISGPLFRAHGGGAFWAMTAFAACGAGIAIFLPRADSRRPTSTPHPTATDAAESDRERDGEG
ncbi:MAG: MFS transporter [Planctomycetes bacterium]|nr:MFS transporter [Planctomycetota bacterium]